MTPIKEQSINKFPYIQYIGRFDGMSEAYSGSTNKRYSSKHGFVKYLSVDGASVKWNQLAEMNQNASSFTVSENVVTVTTTSTSALYFYNAAIVHETGHKYAFVGKVIANPNSITFTFGADLGGPWITGCSAVGEYSSIYTSTYTSSVAIQQASASPAGLQFSAAVYDLTAMFGAGNEPTTVEEFKATDVYKAKAAAGELYDYDAGSLVSIESVTVGGTTIETDLRSAGSVHDELVVNYDEWTVNRNVGYVDLGTLNWAIAATDTANVYRMYVDKSDVAQVGSNSQIANIICSNYVAISSDSAYQKQTGIAVAGTANRIFIYDPNYNTSSSATDFKTAMDGVYLFYELATPTQDEPESINPIEISSSFEVKTEVDTTFEMISGAV